MNRFGFIMSSIHMLPKLDKIGLFFDKSAFIHTFTIPKSFIVIIGSRT